jgi:stage V sporulation protein G
VIVAQRINNQDKQEKINITEVKIFPANEGKLKAYATMVIAGAFIIRDMKIIQSDNGSMFVSMPSRRKKDGTFKDVAHPLDQKTRNDIEEIIIKEFEKVCGTVML